MFLDNKYTKIYYQIIDRAKTRTLDGYKEKHHIIPKSFGGSNKKENLVELTAREHFICHWLLTRMTTGLLKGKMIYAVWMLATNNNPHQKRERISSRKYEILKRLMAEKEISDETRRKMGLGRLGKAPPNKGIKMSEEQKEKLRQVNQGKVIPQEQIDRMIATAKKNGTYRYKGTWSPSSEARAKISASLKGKVPVNKGKKMSEETVAKMKATWTPEKRQKVSETRTGKPLSDSHKSKLKEARAKRTIREREEKTKNAFVGPIRPDTVVEYRGICYRNINQAGTANGISRGMIERQIKAFGNSPSIEICNAIDNGTIKWPRNSVISEETRIKISQAQIGKKVSEETKIKLRLAAKNKPPIKDETKQKLKEAFYKNSAINSPESIEKRRAKRMGHEVTDETKQKIRETLRETYRKKGYKVKDPTAIKIPKERKKLSEETKQKMRKPKSPETKEKIRLASIKREAEKKQKRLNNSIHLIEDKKG